MSAGWIALAATAGLLALLLLYQWRLHMRALRGRGHPSPSGRGPARTTGWLQGLGDWDWPEPYDWDAR